MINYERGFIMAALTSIAANIATIAAWFWGIFTDLINVITSNDLILWPVVLSLVMASVFMALRVIRKFGIRGRR